MGHFSDVNSYCTLQVGSTVVACANTQLCYRQSTSEFQVYGCQNSDRVACVDGENATCYNLLK